MKTKMKKCEHETSSVKFTQIISADTEKIVAVFNDTCNRCGEHLGSEELVFERKQ